MNIFILDREIKKCAIAHCNAHAVKMCLEYAQILSSAVAAHVDANTVNRLKENNAIYRPTHLHHPCVAWAAKRIENFAYVYKLLVELNAVYVARSLNRIPEYMRIQPENTFYGHAAFLKIEKMQSVLRKCGIDLLQCAMPKDFAIAIKHTHRTEFYVPCADLDTAIRLYRAFYIADKKRFATWKAPHAAPTWFI